MHIAFIHPGWPGDEGTGATHTATQMVTGLGEAGHDVDVFCPESIPSHVTAVEASYSLRQLPQKSIPHTNTRYNRAIRAVTDELGTYDIVHSYLPATASALAHVGAETTAKTVLTLNAYVGVCPKNDLLYFDREQCSDNSTLRCLKCLTATSPGHDEYSTPYRVASRLGNLRLIRQSEQYLNDIDAFRAPSQHVKDHYVELGFPSDEIHVIPHPIDEAFDRSHESTFEEPIKLLYVGYLEKHKGVDKLAPIMASLKESSHSFQLTIVGSGGMRSDIETQVSELGVAEMVDIRGFIPNADLPGVYVNHDCFIYPGIWDEPLGRVYLESLATGTPMVTTNYGTIDSIIGAGGVTTDGSVDDFVDTLLGVVRNNRLPELSTGATSQAERYRLDRVIDAIECVYDSL